MSNGKALFPAIARTAFRRLLSFLPNSANGGQSFQTSVGPIATSSTDPIRFRAIEGFSELANAASSTVSTFMAIAEVERFNLLRRQIGHRLANRLIAGMAERLRHSAQGCELGRVGRTSIEFAFTASSIPMAEEKLKAVVSDLESEIDIDGYRFQMAVVIGAAEVGLHPVNEELIDRAAATVTEAQESHRKVKVTGQDTDPTDDTLSQLDLMRDLRLAMSGDGLELHYQPKLRARTNRIQSAEALLRWVHPERGPVSADQLVSAAEASGTINDLTRWVIERAIRDQNRLIAQGFEIRISINLSGALVADTEFCTWAIDKLTGANGQFGIEITETAVIDDPESAFANLKLFSEAGIMIAIDDYGSGLSSLAYLKQLPANELKIDRMFISGLTESHRDPLLVRSTIDLAHALEMDVTAEGVADPMTLSLLRVMGCDLIQGYLISRPIPLSELQAFLSENCDANAVWGLPEGTMQWDLDAAAANASAAKF
jgi:diguanylate cyclase